MYVPDGNEVVDNCFTPPINVSTFVICRLPNKSAPGPMKLKSSVRTFPLEVSITNSRYVVFALLSDASHQRICTVPLEGV